MKTFKHIPESHCLSTFCTTGQPLISRDIFIMETWKDISGYNGRYKVSNTGKVMSIKNGKSIILKPSIGTSGYYFVNLLQKSKDIHRIMANEFIGSVAGKYVNHKDLNKLNNNISNLELVSNRENSHHYFKIKGINEPGIQKIGEKYQVRLRINGIKTYFGRYDTINEAIEIRNKALIYKK